jgi:LytTr DNA-binding domain
MTVLSDIREWTPQVRDRAASIGHFKPALRSWAAFGRPLALAMAFAGFISVSGAFGTNGISPGLRLAVLELTAVALVLSEFALGRALARARWMQARPILRLAITVSAVLTGGVALCWGLALVLEGPHHTPNIARFVPPAIVTLATVTTVACLLRRPRGPRPGSAHPEFMTRLPHRLRRAAIIAVQGEDHYVRVHTSNGQHLLLMRLSEALDQLSGLDGLQTHRSWWVAKPAVTAVKRAHGRAALTLANGVEAPVSRRFSGRLRAQGWY